MGTFSVPSQGSALGIMAISNAPCKGKSFINFRVSFKAFALTGRQVCEHDNPGRCPGLRASAPSGRPASMSFCLLPMFRLVTVGSGRAASMSFCPLPMLSAGNRWFRACCFYELSPFTFALPFGQLFSIPLRAGDRWLRVCWVISTV